MEGDCLRMLIREDSWERDFLLYVLSNLYNNFN